MAMSSHLSRPIVANELKPPPESGRADLAHQSAAPPEPSKKAFSTVLLRIEFTAGKRLRSPGELLPHLSTLTNASLAKHCKFTSELGTQNTSKTLAVYLCCTCPEVAFGGRYPLSLPYGARTFLIRSLSAKSVH